MAIDEMRKVVIKNCKISEEQYCELLSRLNESLVSFSKENDVSAVLLVMLVNEARDIFNDCLDSILIEKVREQSSKSIH